MSDLIERVARAMCDGNWDARNFMETPSGETPEEMRDYWRDKAQAAIAVCMEEAAKVAETRHADDDGIDIQVKRHVASAIRALSQGEQG